MLEAAKPIPIGIDSNNTAIKSTKNANENKAVNSIKEHDL